MFFKELLKPTKIKFFLFLLLFFILGFLKIFTLERAFTGEIYKMSLFEQYKFQFMHYGDYWYRKSDGISWFFTLFLHLVVAYISICLSTFIINRLRERD